MTPATTDLARRAVAAEAFRWMRGTTYVLPGDSGVVVEVEPDGTPWVVTGVGDVESAAGRLADALPDLDDPATRGCLLELVRERVGTERVTCEPFLSRQSGPVMWVCIAFSVIWNGPEADTEAGALVAALEDVSREDSA